MNWINNIVPPGLQVWRKREMPDNLWIKCPDSGRLVFHKDLEANQFVIPGSEYHMRMTPEQRFAHLFDDEDYREITTPETPDDPLKFKDQKRYTDRLRDSRAKTGKQDAVQLADGKIHGLPVVVAVQDFNFMGGSLGTAAGAALLKGMTEAIRQKTPFILFAASGGARMQEGILSLMQMPRVTIGVQQLREAKLPFIVVLTNPTMGGVTASYAMLGDIHIAEPGALIGFAGPRVIEQTIRETLPPGFQRAEYLLEKGTVDIVVHRHKMRDTLSRLCHLLTKKAPPVKKTVQEQEDKISTVTTPVPKAKNKLNIAEADTLGTSQSELLNETPVHPDFKKSINIHSSSSPKTVKHKIVKKPVKIPPSVNRSGNGAAKSSEAPQKKG